MKKVIDVAFNTCYSNKSLPFNQKVIALFLVVVFVIIPLLTILYIS